MTRTRKQTAGGEIRLWRNSGAIATPLAAVAIQSLAARSATVSSQCPSASENLVESGLVITLQSKFEPP